MTLVTITRSLASLTSVTPFDAQWGAVLPSVVRGQAAPGATATKVTLSDAGLTYVVTGHDLALDKDGRLAGGTIGHLEVRLDGHPAVDLGSDAPGGLGLDVAALRAAAGSAAALDTLLSGWRYDYDATGITDTGFAYPVAFEGGRHADHLDGTSVRDDLRGGGGDDVIYGHGGADAIHGDLSDLLMRDDSGNDRLHGGDGNDLVYGDKGDDVLWGDGGDDTIYDDLGVFAGRDTVYAGAGDDSVFAGLGDDSLAGGAGRDRLSAYDFPPEGSGVFVANLATGVSTGQGTDAISGFEDVTGSAHQANRLTGDDGANSLRGGQLGDTLAGAGGADSLWGDLGADTLRGGAGGDRLGGGEGADTLFGGLGADAFVMLDVGHGADRIEDFSSADDSIWLAGPAMGHLWGSDDEPSYDGVVPGFAFKNLASAKADADDVYLYDRASGKLWFDGDAGAHDDKVLLLQLDAGTKLVREDLILHWEVWSGSF